MQQRLNISQISHAIRSHDFTHEHVAERVGILPEQFGQWLSGEVTPVAHRLIRLSMLLGLSFDEMFVSETPKPAEPIVAYRKMAGKITTEFEVERAREKGRLLNPLAKFTHNQHIRSAALRTPSNSYRYIQQVVTDLRKDLRVVPAAPIGPGNLIEKFKELGAIIVPVMWGKRDAHGNALHILLPDSGTTWIFLNLDAITCDFNFWMAHELAHVLTPDLAGSDEGEDFADAFAQALLFPEACAARLYESISGKTTGAIVNAIKLAAEEHTISLYTVFKSLNAYAAEYNLPNYKNVKLYGAVKNFEKQFPSISKLLFAKGEPTAQEYVAATVDSFETPIFDILRAYLNEIPQGPGWLAEVLEIPFLDAKSLFDVLVPSDDNNR